MKNHKDLDVWKKSMDLVIAVYALTKKFPAEELYALTHQIRKSVVSIPSNISEGASRKTNKEFIQSLYIALGSSSELETQIMISEKLGYINKDKAGSLLSEVETIKKMLNGLITSIKKRDGYC